jgi:Tfp pilus assembly protein PilF
MSVIQQATALRHAGRWLEAEHAYKVVLSNEPNLPECWYNLALVQRQIGRFESALACYEEALKLGATKPEEIHLNRGVIFSDELRRPEAAEKELATALELNPHYIPALQNLANLKEEYGDRAGALALYERILSLNPSQYEALARFATLKTVTVADDDLIAKLRQAIARPSSTAGEKASLLFALGMLLDGSGAYDEAFEAYSAANRFSRGSAPPGTVLYDRARHEALVDELIETFTPERCLQSAPASGDPPLFICGMFRSGSTLAEQVLAAHPRVTAGGETTLLPRLVRSNLAPFPSSLKQASAQRLAAMANWYRTSLAALFPSSDLVTDKRPDNFIHIGLIKTLLPNARIVHTTREPLDNCLSVFFTHLDPSVGYALDLMDTGHYYRQYRRLMAHWKSLYGDDILDFDYDTFVREPRPSAERLLKFLDLEWNDACLEFHEAKGVVKTASVWQVRKPLYNHASGRSRHYMKHLTQLQEYLQGL